MSKSLIEWCDRTMNVVDGCEPVSPGCAHCWASQRNGTRLKSIKACVGVHPRQHASLQGVTAKIGVRGELVKPVRRADGGTHYAYNGRVALNTAHLAKALKIPKNGGKAGGRVFWNSESDTFHARLSSEQIAAQFAVMAARPDLRFMVLTKRPEVAARWFAAHPTHRHVRASAAALETSDEWLYNMISQRWRGDSWPLPNVAIGVSAEDQQRWDERVPILLELPAAYRFVSAEPLLGPIDARLDLIWNGCEECHGAVWTDPLTGIRACHGFYDPQVTCTGVRPSAPLEASCGEVLRQGPSVNQVIIGAESGPGARPCELEWIQDLGRQVLDAQTWQPIAGKERMGWVPALFVKQADVCPECGGLGTNCEDCIAEFGDTITARDACDMKCLCGGQGTRGKLRKHCPEVWIPGHGARQWNQHFWEPRQP